MLYTDTEHWCLRVPIVLRLKEYYPEIPGKIALNDLSILVFYVISWCSANVNKLGRSGWITGCMFLCNLPFLFKLLIQPYWSVFYMLLPLFIFPARHGTWILLYAEEKNCPLDFYSCSIGNSVWGRGNKSSFPSLHYTLYRYICCPHWEIMTLLIFCSAGENYMYYTVDFSFILSLGEVAHLIAIRSNSSALCLFSIFNLLFKYLSENLYYFGYKLILSRGFPEKRTQVFQILLSS